MSETKTPEYSLNDFFGHNDYENKYVWIVTDYRLGCYEGDGESVALLHNGDLAIFNLSHCSCNSPMHDNDGLVSTVSKDDFLHSVICSCESEKLFHKVQELLLGGE